MNELMSNPVLWFAVGAVLMGAADTLYQKVRKRRILKWLQTIQMYVRGERFNVIETSKLIESAMQDIERIL